MSATGLLFKCTAHPPARHGLPLCSPRHRPTGDPHVDEDHAGRRALALVTTLAHAQDNKLRLITWSDYVPADVVAQFKKETGIDVEVTLSNNEEMISKLRATGGAGFDLAQPCQDRIAGPQPEFGIYKPIDLSKIKSELFIPSMLEATKKNTTLDGKVYGAAPHLGHRRPRREHQDCAQIADYTDLCKAELKGKTCCA